MLQGLHVRLVQNMVNQLFPLTFSLILADRTYPVKFWGNVGGNSRGSAPITLRGNDQCGSLRGQIVSWWYLTPVIGGIWP